jgi:scyllo-inositol 2-dehydrogenase (NADP+)
MPDPIRVAVLGFGLAGRVFHCPFVSAIPGLELAAIVQRRGDEAAQAYPQATILRSPEEAFANPDIDLIVVGTPNETHEAFARAALAAGKHVVVDKPLAPSSEAVRKLIDAARDAGKLLFPFHNRRWDGDFLTLQQVLAENKLGRVVKAIATWDRFRPAPRPGTWKEAAGDAHGILQDLGPHLIDQALALFGSPQRLTGAVHRIREGSEIEDAFDLVLSFDRPGGHSLDFECHASIIAADPAPRFRVHGTSGSFTKCGIDPQEAHLVADGRHPPTLGSSVPWISEPESSWGTLTTAADPIQRPQDLTRTPVPTLTGDYRFFYANVRDAILGDAPQAVSGIDAWRVARIIELTRESSHQRRTLEVSLDAELRPA